MAHPLESLIQKYNPQTLHDFENALKEVIQEMTLAGLARANFFNKAAFYGGTALRIFYGLPRFSEDLDFTLLQGQPDFSLKNYFSSVESILQSFGVAAIIDEVKKSKDKKIESAFLKANTKIHLLKIGMPLASKVQSNKVMHIKFEVDIVPPLGFETEVKTLFPPITAAIKVLKPSSLFAGKMHAVLFRAWEQRIKGRDFYDLLWFMGQNIPLKLGYLEQKMKDTKSLEANEKLQPKEVIQLLEKKIKTIDWESARQDVIHFLKDPQEGTPWTKDFFIHAIDALKFEP
ncbi:MAG: nucleotidyl transferase AbiEii/AbiGii toxin family protein [Deltaproteobacteria bacterium]|nr:nucleotidyl transferase AbiEii/AbiGii toxin family protein [Deltaproteobacteria bacterium]